MRRNDREEKGMNYNFTAVRELLILIDNDLLH